MRKDELIWAHGIKAMSAFLKKETDKLRETRTQAVGAFRNAADADERAIAESKIREIDREMQEWAVAYMKVTTQPDFG